MGETSIRDILPQPQYPETSDNAVASHCPGVMAALSNDHPVMSDVDMENNEASS